MKPALDFGQFQQVREAALRNAEDCIRSASFKWHREQHEQERAQMRDLLQRELLRDVSSAPASSATPKWRITFRIYSHSHSVRQKALNAWNAKSKTITLTATNKKVFSSEKKDELICTLVLPDTVSAAKVWDTGRNVSRSFLCALNIATAGFFWWYVPNHPGTSFSEIFDIENAVYLKTGLSPRLEIAWGNLALNDAHLTKAAAIFEFITQLSNPSMVAVFDRYAAGLTWFSKIDVHLRCEQISFEVFWTCFKEALRAAGDWTEGGNLEATCRAAFQEVLPDVSALTQYLLLGGKFDDAREQKSSPPVVTLTHVVGMKLYCDLYLGLKASEFASS